MSDTKTKSVIEKIAMAKKRAVPLISITTGDPADTISQLIPAFSESTPILEWNYVDGFKARNEKGKMLSADPCEEAPQEALVEARTFEQRTVIFFHMADRYMDEVGFLQAVWNLRDPFKASQRMLVMLGSSFSSMPAELHDVEMFDWPMPDEERYYEIMKELHDGQELEFHNSGKAVETVTGLTAFQADQVTAMSLTKNGVDIDGLWERKRKKIDQTPGLTVYNDGARFEDIGGVSVVKSFIRDILKGNDRPNAVVFIDEIEKSMGGGTSNETSGTNADQLRTILTHMQNSGVAGMIFVGPPGAAKSAIAQSAGNEGEMPTIELDLGGMKDQYVGSSEARIREALEVVDSVSNGRSLWIATCNNIQSLPPELRRRFTLGTFFFDIPDEEEREAIWKIYKNKLGLKGKNPDSDGWTGAEIKQCAEIAWKLDKPLKDAAKYVVPVSVSAREQLTGLRKSASGRYLSASKDGVYQYNEDEDVLAEEVSQRQFSLDD